METMEEREPYSSTDRGDPGDRGGYATDHSDQSDQGESKFINDVNRGRAANFFINGDVFFTAKRVVYNPKHFKDMSHYLDYLTDRMAPRFGAVRKIHTPKYGHRIADLKDLKENASYVVAGSERFKTYPYEQIAPTDKRKSPPFKYDADPVYHNRQYLRSGKINKIDTHAVLIKVWPNGGDLRGPRRVLLNPRVRPFTLENVVSQVNDILKEDCLGTVEKLFMLNGIKVSDIDQIQANGQYVACRKSERFKKAKYHEQGVKNLATSPRLERKLLAPLHPRSYNSTNQSTPEQSNESTQNSVHSYPFRQKMLAKEDNVFPAKPVKYQRVYEKPNSVDYDADQGGVFKAKQSNKTTKDAREVPDSRTTKTEYPIDQQEAEEVEQEEEPVEPSENETETEAETKAQPETKAQVQAKDEEEENITDSDEKGPSKSEPKQNVKKHDEIVHPKNHTKEQQRHTVTNKANDKTGRKSPPVNKPKKEKADDKDKKVEPASKHSQKAVSKKPDPRLEEFDEEDRAAATIQAGFRGYQTRKNLSLLISPTKEPEGKKGESDHKEKKPAKQQRQTEDEEEKAAMKIQAGFRGYRTRKRIKEEQSALVIQSGYRGYQTRKNLAEEAKAKAKEKPKQQDTSRDKKPKAEAQKEPEDDTWEQEEQAATKIQSAFRGYTTRKNISAQNQTPPVKSTSRTDNEAAAKIQASYRGHRARKEMLSNQDAHRQNSAAVRVQAGYRGYRTRKRISSSEKRAVEERSASKIQAAYRGHRYRKTNQSKLNDDQEEKIKAAEKIQAGYKGYRIRQQLDEEERAASKIQASFRGYASRKHVKKSSSEEKEDDHVLAALRIQAGYRGYRERKIVAAYKENKAADKIKSSFKGHQVRKEIKQKEESAVKIQAAYRGHRTRRQFERENSAAIRIQTGYRSHQTRERISKSNNSRANQPDADRAAIKIQSNYRGYATRKKFGAQQRSAVRSNEEMKRQHEAAKVIQKHYRTYRTKKT